jgi:hypothetical protein
MSIATAEVQQTKTLHSAPSAKYWIINPVADFCLLHAGAGLVLLPIAVIAYNAGSWWPGLLVANALLLGLPHITSTYIRLADADCARSRRALGFFAPLGILCAMSAAILGWGALPYLVLLWLGLQTWHNTRQNFGIYRRYMRMAASPVDAPVNLAAAWVIQALPWVTVASAFLVSHKTYVGQPIYSPDPTLVAAALIPAVCLGLLLLVGYVILEFRELLRGRFVPGRFLCCLSGTAVNVLAWVVVGEISWAYLIAASWHELQYVSYTDSFRQSPPPQAAIRRMSRVKYLGSLLCGSLLLYGFLSCFLACPLVLIVINLSINFHHYLCDTFIWRSAPKPIA